MMLRVHSPIDGSLYAERQLASPSDLRATLRRAQQAQALWRRVSISERATICERFVQAMEEAAADIAEELSWQMGRPRLHALGEVKGLAQRARHMGAIAAPSLEDIDVPAKPGSPKPGLTRFIRREPLGVVFTIAAWNFPYLIAVNSVIPAIMAGNAVVLKSAAQTPLVAERFAQGFAQAGLPEGVFQFLHMSHALAAEAVAAAEVRFVAFTGSVAGGRAIQAAAGQGFAGVGLELGGKDPAYVRPDADIDHAAENLVDGAFFNAGQSCCGIERIYVHGDVFERFVDAFVQRTQRYVLGNPLEANTTIGPLVKTTAAEYVRQQVADALAAGARLLVDERSFAAAKPGTPYLGPQVLVDVDHRMALMRDESFGPVVGIMKVASDEAAIALMNDSDFGLTASVWTRDEDAARRIGDAVDTGTVFMNRCDYLDPALAWVGVKHSGRGVTLSRVGYEQLTRPKSFYLRHVP